MRGMEAPLARATAAPQSLPTDSESCAPDRPPRCVASPGRPQLAAAALCGAPAPQTPAAPPAGGM